MSMPYLKSANDLLILLRYLAFTISEGDWLNDWLTHLPETWRPTLIEIGKQLAQLMEVTG
jgi:hypothetical protein